MTSSGSSGLRRVLGAAPVIAALIALAGCGGGASQDADEPRGTYTAEITQASFPPLQGLGQTSRMRVTVRNAGRETIPDVALTVDGLAAREAQPDAMDASRPIWVIDLGPVGGKTAYVNTWALGPLAAGRERTFTFVLTAMTAGTHLVRYRVGAGLNGNAIARTPADTVPEGSFTVRITRRPRVSSVNPRTGAVIHRAP